MPKLPADAILLSDLVAAWPAAMPRLRDQGEADRMNELLGSLLYHFKQSGREIPQMVMVTDAPPDDERAKLLGSDEASIKTAWFQMAFSRWDQSPQFKRLWASLDDKEKAAFWHEVA